MGFPQPTRPYPVLREGSSGASGWLARARMAVGKGGAGRPTVVKRDDWGISVHGFGPARQNLAVSPVGGAGRAAGKGRWATSSGAGRTRTRARVPGCPASGPGTGSPLPQRGAACGGQLRRRGGLAQAGEDAVACRGVGDEGNDAHLGRAPRAAQGEDLVRGAPAAAPTRSERARARGRVAQGRSGAGTLGAGAPMR